MSLNQPVGIPHQNPRDYTGPEQNIVPIKRFPRQPLTTDKRYRIGQTAILGKNPTTGVEGELWYLARFDSNGNAIWLPFTTGQWTEVTSTTASGDASIIFTGLTEYNEYKFQIEDLVPANISARLEVEFSIDNGSTYLTGGCSSEGNDSLTRDEDFIEITSSGGGVQSNTAASSMFGWFILGRNTEGSEFPSWRGFAIYNTGAPDGGYSGGIITNASTSDIDALRWTYDNGNIASGTLRVFGR